jgi:hypothetical protein
MLGCDLHFSLKSLFSQLLDCCNVLSNTLLIHFQLQLPLLLNVKNGTKKCYDPYICRSHSCDDWPYCQL